MNKIIRKLMELGALEDQSCSEAERLIIKIEAEKVWNELVTDCQERIENIYNYKQYTDVSETLPKERIDAYNSRQSDRRDGAKRTLALVKYY